LREDLNTKAKRVLAVLNPIKITIINYPENRTEYFEAINNPQDDNPEVRQIPFSRTIYIEKDDFMIDPPSRFFRLSLGREVRLRYAYIIKCHEVITDPNTGEISEIKCTYDPDTRGGQTLDGRKVKGTIHWVSKKHAIQAQIRLYDRLCIDTNPDISAETNLSEILNPASLTIIETAQLEPSLANSKPGDKFQFERLGYFCLDTKDSSDTKLVFNRAATLKDTWNKRNSSNLK
jgi:glutaminyl-tRNA synthetase